MTRARLGQSLSAVGLDRYVLPSQANAADWLGGASLRVSGAVNFPGTSHTMSGWTEVVAATTAPVTVLFVKVESHNFVSGGDSSTLIDIGIGAASSETVLIPYLAGGYHIDPDSREYWVPVSVPVGSRLSVRCQSVRTTGSVTVSLLGMNLAGWRQPPTFYPTTLAIGVDAAASHGTILSAPGGTNTKGAWTELTSSCPQHLAGLIVQAQGAEDVSLHGSGMMLDIGIGQAGSEVVVVSNVNYYATTQEVMAVRQPVTFAANIPQGARIAARYQRQNANNALDCHLLGIPA